MYGGFTQHAFIVVGSSQLNHTYIHAHTTTISVLEKFPVCKHINVWAQHMNVWAPKHLMFAARF